MFEALFLFVAAALAVVFAFTIGALGAPAFDLGSLLGAAIMIISALIVALFAAFSRYD